MRIVSKKAILLLPLLLLAFSPEDRTGDPVNYYSLGQLSRAGMPRKIRVMKAANSSLHKPVIEEGVLVTFKNREADRVDVAGNFSNWRTLRMERGSRGVWYYLITNPPGGEIKYKFVVDGIWSADPRNPQKSYDGNGSYISIIEPFTAPEGRHVSFRIVDRGIVEFRIHNPRAGMISLVGDFNHWNPENDLMQKGPDGIWRLQKRLSRGDYRYKYIIDGRWQPDYYNSNSASDEVGGICSVIRIN